MTKLTKEILEEFDNIVWPQSLQILADSGVGSYGKEEMVRVELRSFLQELVKRVRAEERLRIVEWIGKNVLRTTNLKEIDVLEAVQRGLLSELNKEE